MGVRARACVRVGVRARAWVYVRVRVSAVLICPAMHGQAAERKVLTPWLGKRNHTNSFQISVSHCRKPVLWIVLQQPINLI